MVHGRSRNLRPNKKVLARKRKALLIRGGIAVFLLLTLIGGLAYASGREEITIRNISVLGNSTVPTEDLLQLIEKRIDGRYGFLFARSNAFLYPRKSIEAHVLDSYTRIREVQIDRTDVNTIELSVVERRPFALWCDRNTLGKSGEQCFFVDDDGFIYTEAPLFTGPVFFTYYSAFKESPIGNYVLPTPEFEAMSQFVTTLENFGLEPVSLVFEEQHDAIVHMADGSELLFNREDTLSIILENLETVLTSEEFQAETAPLDYIDLRFGNNVYFKVK